MFNHREKLRIDNAGVIDTVRGVPANDLLKLRTVENQAVKLACCGANSVSRLLQSSSRWREPKA
jgi:hypothetical protein